MPVSEWSSRLREAPEVGPGKEGAMVFVLVRGVTYASLFVGLLLVFLPARILTTAGIVRPASIGSPEIAGIIIAAAGAVLAGWCIVAFALIGKGTPAIFDPPRRLVVRGPYRFVRNPMYIGAGLAIAGAALFYRSADLLAYGVLFVFVIHLFVLFYEERVLDKKFGREYAQYRLNVRRWLPRL